MNPSSHHVKRIFALTMEFQLNAEFHKLARREKAFLSEQYNEIEENNRMGRLEISSRKLEIPREYFMQR